MKHRANPRFWRCYRQLPKQIQRLADESYNLLRADPQHPALHFKKMGRFWSVRIGLHYRALAVRHEIGCRVVLIGPHAEYRPAQRPGVAMSGAGRNKRSMLKKTDLKGQ